LQHKINEGTYPSLAVLIQDIDKQVKQYGSLSKIPAEAVGNTRNDMYLASEALRYLMKDKDNELSKDEVGTLNGYKQSLDEATKFIPTWVKVAIALGLGTMIGWKRIVITVGEKIGKSHLTYGQGAAAEIVAAGTIAPPTCTAFRYPPPTCCRRVSPGPWRPTDRGCSSRRSATSRSHGC
jgi:PiT family inorganic phosphate transporter